MAHGDRRRRRGDAWAGRGSGGEARWADAAEMLLPREPTRLHTQRLDTVHAVLHAAGAACVVDLGCGDGALVERLAGDPGVRHVVALDRSAEALARLRQRLPPAAARVTVLQGSFADPAMAGEILRAAGAADRDPAREPPIDAAVLLETIEHVPLARLSAVEELVFVRLRPALAVITTPNQACNERLGMAPGQMREPSHCFEWTRSRFRQWAEGVARRRGYGLWLQGIGDEDPFCGAPTQMACFTRDAFTTAATAPAARPAAARG